MKKFMVAMMMLAMASVAMAAPLAQTAAPVEVGQMDGAAMITLGLGDAMENVTPLDVRVTYGAIENMLVSLDVTYNMIDIEGVDNTIGFAVAGQYALTLDIPVELAVRAELSIDDMDNSSESMSVTPAVVVSKAIEAVAGLSLYAGVGYYIPVGDLADAIDGGLAFAAGATYDIAAVENLSVVAEVSMVDPGVEGIDATDTLGLTVGASYAF